MENELTSGTASGYPDMTLACSTGYCQCAAKDQRIAALEAHVAGLTADIDWIERAARKGFMPRWSRHDQMWFINDEDAYQTFRAALDAARKAGA